MATYQDVALLNNSLSGLNEALLRKRLADEQQRQFDITTAGRDKDRDLHQQALRQQLAAADQRHSDTQSYNQARLDFQKAQAQLKQKAADIVAAKYDWNKQDTNFKETEKITNKLIESRPDLVEFHNNTAKAVWMKLPEEGKARLASNPYFQNIEGAGPFSAPSKPTLGVSEIPQTDQPQMVTYGGQSHMVPAKAKEKDEPRVHTRTVPDPSDPSGTAKLTQRLTESQLQALLNPAPPMTIAPPAEAPPAAGGDIGTAIGRLNELLGPAPASAPAPAADAIPEGTAATHKQTGQKLIRKGGKWIPL